MGHLQATAAQPSPQAGSWGLGDGRFDFVEPENRHNYKHPQCDRNLAELRRQDLARPLLSMKYSISRGAESSRKTGHTSKVLAMAISWTYASSAVIAVPRFLSVAVCTG